MKAISEESIIERAVRALTEETGLKITESKQSKRNIDSSDIQLCLADSESAGAIQSYRAEIKNHVGNAVIGEFARQIATEDEKRLLVAEYISQPQAQKLRDLNIPFFDTAGNVFLKENGLYIFVSGKKAVRPRQRTPRLFRPPGMKLLFAFLTTPNLENASYRQISAETNVPTPTVGVFMNDLEKAGYLRKRGAGERILTGKNELFKRWVTAFGESFRETLEPVRFISRKYDGRWWEDVNINDYGAVWGGETGGAHLTNHLKPAEATIYSDSILPRFQAKYGLVRDERGNIEILKKFWMGGETADVAPPLVVYADLIATADERNIETAQIIYDQYLAEFAEADS